jgi:hypothetical protein
MKKTILVILMAVMIATPCLAQEVEPEGLFSLNGTLWNICSIAFFPEPIMPPFVEIACGEEMGFYQGKAYNSSLDSGYYIDLGVVSIAYGMSIGGDTNRYILAIMQPAIGFGVESVVLFHHWCGKYGCAIPFFGYVIGIMHKINDNWTPPGLE